MKKRAQWALARLMYRFGLPYWWVTPHWTQEELDAIQVRARERAAQMRRHFS